MRSDFTYAAKFMFGNVPKILHFKVLDLVTFPLSFITFKLIDKISNQIDITVTTLAAPTTPKGFLNLTTKSAQVLSGLSFAVESQKVY